MPSTLYIGERKRERRSRIPPTERWEVREGETCDRKGIRGEGKENGCRGKSTDESSVFKIPMRLRGFAFSSTREKKAADVRECGRKGDAMVGSGGLCRRRPKRWCDVGDNSSSSSGGGDGDGGGSGAGGGESDAGRRVAVDRLPRGQIRVYPVAERDEANFG